MRCADCKATVEEHRSKWAERTGPGEWTYTCRAVVDDGRLVSADYHYVKGEQQRHWPALDD